MAAAVLAAVAASAPAAAAVDLTVSPDRIDLRLAPGESTVRSIELRNADDAAVGVRASLIDWVMTDDGAIRFERAGSTARSCADRLQLVPEATVVPPGGRAEIVLVSRMPTEDPARGTCWSAVLFELPEVDSVEDGREIRLALRLSTSVYLTGIGAAPADLRLELTEPDAGAPPTVIAANDGDTVARVALSWEARDGSGARVAGGRLEDEVILPAASRVFRLGAVPGGAPGLYLRVALDGEDGRHLEQETLVPSP